MTIKTDSLANAYVQATNKHDEAAFVRLFAEDAVVDDNFREFAGRAAIEEWAHREIFAANVTLDVLDIASSENGADVTTKVDGDFDRTGLPDPVVIRHTLALKEGKIGKLTCRLAAEARR